MEQGTREKMLSVKSNRCLKENRREGVAAFTCFTCELDLCYSCSVDHENHRCVQLNSEAYTRKIRRIWEEVKNETDREEKFMEEKAEMYDRINVRTEHDIGCCHVTGMCILEHSSLVVCDRENSNSCIKLFDLRNYSLQRYISLDSPPYGVTELDLRKSQSLSSDSTLSNTPGTTEQRTRNVIAITFPQIHEIVFLDLNYQPAKKTKVIQTEKPCFAIDNFSNNIYVAYIEESHMIDVIYDGYWSVYIMSSDGDILHSFRSGVYGFYRKNPFTFPTLHVYDILNPLCIAVLPGRIYLTEPWSKKVVCKDLSGKTTSTIYLENDVFGIYTDKAGENVYMCTPNIGSDKNILYKLSSDLTQGKKMVDFKFDYCLGTSPLCYYKDRLFVADTDPYFFSTTDYVKVIRIL